MSRRSSWGNRFGHGGKNGCSARWWMTSYNEAGISIFMSSPGKPVRAVRDWVTSSSGTVVGPVTDTPAWLSPRAQRSAGSCFRTLAWPISLWCIYLVSRSSPLVGDEGLDCGIRCQRRGVRFLLCPSLFFLCRVRHRICIDVRCDADRRHSDQQPGRQSQATG